MSEHPNQVPATPGWSTDYSGVPASAPRHAASRVAKGQLMITISGSIMTAVIPTLLIDGVPVSAHFGDNPVIVPAGSHHVELYGQWLRRYGYAAIDVQVPPGENVHVFYAPPMHQLIDTGDIGFEPQRRRGKLSYAILLPVAIVVAFLIAGTLAQLRGR